MVGNFFTGATNGRPVVTGAVAGSTRFNISNNHYEVFDGTNWVSMGSGRDLTMQEMIQHLEDKLFETIEEDYADSVAIQDAFKAWEEAI